MHLPGEAARSVAPPPGRSLLYSTEADRFFDYCLQPYEPRRSPVGKLRAENLLWTSFDLAGVTRDVQSSVDAIQRRCGRDMTVFGVKHEAGRLFWELYFYDPRKEDARVTATSVIDALAPIVRLGPAPSEAIPYFMFSFDLDGRSIRQGSIDGINLYLPAKEVQGGRSYKLTSTGMELENSYRFLHPKLEIEKILYGLRSSVFVDFDRTPLSRVLFPELFACRRICISKKRRMDAIYYSGIEIERLIWFMQRFNYPAPLMRYAEENRAGFDHLLFDVGVDYRADEHGEIVWGKTSFYGTF